MFFPILNSPFSTITHRVMNSDAFFKTLMKARRLAWLVGVLYITGCVALGVEFDPMNRNQWLMAATLGLVVGVSWILYPLVQKFMRYRKKLFEELNLGLACKTLGIQKIYPNGVSRKSIRDRLAQPGIKSVKVLANSAKTYMIHYAAEVWPMLLASHEVKIQILIAKEGSEFVEKAAKMENINANRVDPISPSIVEVKLYLAEIAHRSNRRDFIEVRQFDSQIRANLIIIDDNWCSYTPHLPPVSPMNSFAFELTESDTAQGKTMLQACIDHFQVVWDQSKNDSA